MSGRDALSGSPPIDTLTEFESFSSVVEELTTSNTPVVKSLYPFTSEIKSAGFYSINYSAQVGQLSNNQLTQLIVEWRPGTSGTWLEILNTEQELRDVGFVPWSGFSIVELTSDQQLQIRIRYSNPGSGTARIKQANITIGKVKG